MKIIIGLRAIKDMAIDSVKDSESRKDTAKGIGKVIGRTFAIGVFCQTVKYFSTYRDGKTITGVEGAIKSFKKYKSYYNDIVKSEDEIDMTEI